MLVALQAHVNGIILSGKLGPGGMALPGTSGGSAFVVPMNLGLIALHKTSQTTFWSQIFIWNARPTDPFTEISSACLHLIVKDFLTVKRFVPVPAGQFLVTQLVCQNPSGT